MPAGQVHAAKTHCPQGHPYSGDNLYVHENKETGKKSRYCRTCLRERRRAYVAKDENRERLRIREAQRSRSRRGLNRDLHLRRHYGITLAEYEALKEAQKGVCAACGQPQKPSRSHPDLVVDHCHESGEVRGLLCNNCNAALGQVREDPEILMALHRYLTDR